MRLPPRYTPPDTLFPYTTLSRYHGASNRREKAGNRGNKRLALSHVPSSLPVRRLADCPVRGGGRARRGRPHHRKEKGARRGSPADKGGAAEKRGRPERKRRHGTRDADGRTQNRQSTKTKGKSNR